MGIAKVFKPLFTLFTNVFLRIAALKAILEKVACAVTIGHDVNGYSGNRIQAAKPSSVGTVACHRERTVALDLVHAQEHYFVCREHQQRAKLGHQFNKPCALRTNNNEDSYDPCDNYG